MSRTVSILVAAALAAGCITLQGPRPDPGTPPTLQFPETRSQVDNDALVRKFGGAPLWTTMEDGPPLSAIPLNGATYAELARKASPAVVNLFTTLVAKGSARIGLEPFGILPGIPVPLEREGNALGTGFVIHPDGLILTSNHVVAGATEIRVILGDGATELPGKIVGTDAKTDLALLHVESPTPLPALPLGDSDTLRIGEVVMAIGNPFGLSQTVTTGIVSQLGRVIGLGPYDDFIQTDASINPGNSGGPLINLRGEAVGLNTAIAPVGQGLGFSTPIQKAKLLLPQLLRGEVVRAWLGVATRDVNEAIDRALGLGGRRGAVILGVESGSPAERAGLVAKDVVVRLGSTEIESARDLGFTLADMKPGARAEITVIRAGRERTLTATLGRQP